MPEKHQNRLQNVPCCRVPLMKKFRKRLNTAKIFKFQRFFFLLEKYFFGSFFIGKWQSLTVTLSFVFFQFLNLNNMVKTMHTDELTGYTWQVTATPPSIGDDNDFFKWKIESKTGKSVRGVSFPGCPSI